MLVLGVAVTMLFAIFTFSMVTAHRTHNYTSDDVAQQNVLLNSGKYGPQEAWIGVDNFVVKLPFYQLVNSTLGESRTSLLVTVLFFNTVAFIGLVATFWLIWREKLRAKQLAAPIVLGLVGFLWIASLGGNVAQSLINPNVRNAEVGICIFLAVLAIFWAQRKKAPWWGTVLISLLTGVMLYSDPYFLYTLFIPLAALPVYYFFFDQKNAGKINNVRLYVLIAASFAVYKLSSLGTSALGFNVYQPDVLFAGMATFGTNIFNVASSFLYIFNGNFFGQVAGMGALVFVANAVLAFLFVGCSMVYLVRRRFESPYAILCALVIAVTIVLYGVTTNSDSMATVRYMILVPFAVLFLVPFVLERIHNKRVKIALVCLLVATSIGNVVLTTQIATTRYNLPANQWGNAQNYQVLGVLDSRDLEKGYADYWDGNIHSYLSGGKHLTIPVVCNGTQLQVYYWLMDAAWLNKKTDRSYIIYDSTVDSFRTCNKEVIAAQFGEPSEVVHIDEHRELMVFDYDVYMRMPQRTSTKQP